MDIDKNNKSDISLTNLSQKDKVEETEKTKGYQNICCSENAKWGEVLFQYSQETAFDGPKQIIEHQPFIVRRLIWLLLFLGGMTIFLLQVAVSIEYYLSSPVSVDVKINYNESIMFPAVTICNGNAFRTTKAYEYGYYNLIDDIFGLEITNVNVSKYNIPNLNLEDLHRRLGHWKDDLIVSCKWDQLPCSSSDFTTSMTDYGMCYTFNGYKEESPIKWASRTGAEGGLRLQLNIEQYQYMRGPNEGAGLKILIHNPSEIPLVKDHGIAVPPGSHGLVAVKTVEVNNLEPNHGKCNDSVQLDYFNSYSVSSCYTDCKERHLVNMCGCRDIYMPSYKGEPKVCSVSNYISCMREAAESFKYAQNASCVCPIPCHRLLYKPTVSYASTSNFDIDALLRTNSSDHLRKEYIHAREATQRVNEAIVQEDKMLISALNVSVETLNRAYNDISDSLTQTQSLLQEYFEVMQRRVKFHEDRGLHGIRYTMEHDFRRGWQVFQERSFHYVTIDFMDLSLSLKRTIENARENVNLTSISERFLVYSPVMNKLMGRRDLVANATNFLKRANRAYRIAQPIIPFRLTYESRYDEVYNGKPLLQALKAERFEQYTQLMEGINKMNLGISLLQEVGNQFLRDGSFNETTYLEGEDNFISGCKIFNFRIFMFSDRVVEKPIKKIKAKLQEFELQNRTLHRLHFNVMWKIQQIKDILYSSIEPIWHDVLNVSHWASKYLRDNQVLKTPLSESATSKSLAEAIRTITVLFNDIRSRVRELHDQLVHLKMEYITIWTSMLLEETTREVYEMIHVDCEDFLTNETKYEMYINIFSYMLRMNRIKLRQLNREDIYVRMNGDFHTFNISNVTDDIEEMFHNISRSLDFTVHVGDADKLFLKLIDKFVQAMKVFLEDNSIDSRFYRENFMKLDVYMQELSYEEISQHKSYEITQLLSDIGGSMGLFIGGSVLSVFEFIDIFVHHGARIVFKR